MTTKPRNLKRAESAIRRRIQRIAFDANLYDRGLCGTPHAEKCSKERILLLKEIEKLHELTEDGSLLGEYSLSLKELFNPKDKPTKAGSGMTWD